MQTITIEITGNNALQALRELEQDHQIRILAEPEIHSPVLPGEPISEEDFKKWIKYAEESPTSSLSEAKQRWAAQKKKLQKHIR
nr:hypothetical protein [Bacteroidota bacterium]